MKSSISKQIKNVLNITNILLFVYSIVVFIFKDKIGTNLLPINASFFMLITFFCALLLGYKKDKKNILKDKIKNTYLGISVIYIILIYIIGNLYGFSKTTYTILNSIYLITYVLSREVLRYIICQKNSKDNIELYIITFIFMLIDTLVISSFSPTHTLHVSVLIPTIIISTIKHSLLTYTSYKFGYRCSIMYLICIELLPELAPIYPDLSNYIRLVFAIIYSSFIYYFISKPYRREELETANSYKKSPIFYIERISLVLVFIIIFLVSGMFKFSMSAIASNSMYPELKRGDAVIIEEVTDKNRDTLKKDMIVAYEEDGSIITHRIVSIEMVDGVEYVITKGDNNDIKDVTKKTKDDIIGIVRFKIPFLGYPSVEISETRNK